MSAICGIVNLDQASVCARELAAMMEALLFCGPDGAAVWQDGPAGLGFQRRNTTPQSLTETLPCYDPTTGLAITADARLDNREELCSALDVPHAGRVGIPDSRLILLAYEKWGERCPTHLLGDFAFVVWDSRRQQIFGARDPLGVRPFYYAHDGPRFLFASAIKGLRAISGVGAELHRKKLAAVAVSGLHHHLDSTFFAGVKALPGANSLTVDAQGLRQQTYWTPDSNAVWPYKSDAEALEAFRALLFEAVRTRLRSASPVAALLSGGLDSSGIVSVAAQLLAAQGQSLTTISSVLHDPQDADFKDERQYIEQFRGWPNITFNYVTADGNGPCSHLTALTEAAESPLSTSRHYLYTALAQAARGLGARVLLDGIGGELGPTCHAAGYYAELLTRFRWRALRRELARKRQADGATLWQAVRSEILAHVIPYPVLQLWRRRNTKGSTIQAHVFREAFVQAEWGTDWDMARAWESEMGRVWPDHRRTQQRDVFGFGLSGPGGDSFAGAEWVETRYPFLDRRVIEFCLAAPGRLKVRDGYSRALLRFSLDGILPPAIQWRTTKGAFAPDYYRRFEAQRQQAQDFLAAIGPADPVREIVDVAKLQSWAASNKEKFVALHLVPQGIYTICFLRRFFAAFAEPGV